MSLQVLVIGSGQRVRRAALPALLARDERFRIAGVFSRKPKEIHAEDTHGAAVGAPIPVAALEGLSPGAVAAADLIYVCVSKGAVPKVLAQLAGLVDERSRPALLIDTPVLLFKHMAAARHFGAFRSVWVAEDMSTLPWLDVVRAAEEQLGAPQRLWLDRSAYAYHGVALAKTLLGSMQLKSASRKRLGEGRFERRLRFSGGADCTIVEPRDYSIGGLRLECAAGVLFDPGAGPADLDVTTGPHYRLTTRFDSERIVGFEARATEPGAVIYSTDLPVHEVELLGSFDEEAQRQRGVIAHMDAMKRVGFARLLDHIAEEAPLWGLLDGLDDMWVDYLLEKSGRYLATPLTSAHSGLARKLVGLTMAAALKVKG